MELTKTLAQFISLSPESQYNVKTEIIYQVTLEKILISLEMVGLFSLDTSEGNDRNHILCLLLSELGSVFHPNGDTRQP